MSQKHYSDDTLLACRDGELSGRARSAVEKHLELCWLCRSRQAELEEQIRAAADVFREQDFPDPGWVERSKIRFLQWRERFERNSPRFHGLTPLSWFSHYRITALVSIAAVCIVLLVAWYLGWRMMPSPADIVAKSRVAEREQERQAICQVFRVEIAQVKPVMIRHESRLTVWSEKDGQRFASRWEEQGALKHAAWRPSDGRRYNYNPVAGSHPVTWSRAAKMVSVAELADHGLDFPEMEAAFLTWLESREWRPISLTWDLSVFASQEGVTLTAERTRLEDGKQVLQLVARRQSAGFAAELAVQVDPINYLPRLQRIRFEAPGRAAEFSLSVDRIQAIPPAQLVPALFEPDVHIAGRQAGGEQGMSSGRRSQVLDETNGPIPTISEEIGREVEVQYALHRIGACLGEEIELIKRPSGRILIRALVENEQRKTKLGAALGALTFVDAEIKNLSEVPDSRRQRSPALGPSTDITVAGSELAIQGLLEASFKQRYESAEVPGRIAEVANQLTSLSGSVLAEAWAIRRLATEFPASRADGLRGAPRWLLEKMLQDHTSALAGKGRRLHEILASVLPGSIEAGQGISAPKSDTASDWSSAAIELLDTTERIDRLARALFAGAAPPEDDPRTALKELSGMLSELDSDGRALESAVSLEFRDSPEQLWSGRGPKRPAAAGSKKEKRL